MGINYLFLMSDLSSSSSPKHKPKEMDDSPIRRKEACYGGGHVHTKLSILDTHQQARSANQSVQQRAILNATLVSLQQTSTVDLVRVLGLGYWP